MNFIKKVILWVAASGLAIFITAKVLPAYLIVEWWLVAYWLLWLVFWLLDSIIKPVLKLISIPFILITAGLFMIIINAVVIYLLEYFFTGMPTLNVVFDIQWWSLYYAAVAVILSIINYITHWIIDIK